MTDGVDDSIPLSKAGSGLAAQEAHAGPPADTDGRDQANARIIAASGFFDAEWYAAKYPGVLASGLAPELHYVRHGGAKGWSPSPGFDAADYLAKHKDVRQTGMNPLLHYIAFGKSEARKVRPADADEVNARLILKSGFFDAEWYVAKYPEVLTSGVAPALHYIKTGGAKGWPPGPGFDAADYLARHKDVRQTAMNPLVHYITFGVLEARQVKPADADELNARLIMRSGLFDVAWYKATYPEVAKSRLPPLRYFLKHGREKGHNPSLRFDSREYAAAHGDVESSKINPLLHYLQFGRSEGRTICEVKAMPEVAALVPAAPDVAATPKETKEQARDPKEFAADVALIESCPLFDRAWYFNRYPEIARLGIAAAEHYLRFGATELRQPSIYFDPQYYVIEQSPEIQQTGINPLLHFLKTGRALGRKPRALFEFAPSPGGTRAPGLMDWPVPATGAAMADNTLAWTRQAEIEEKPGPFSLSIGGRVVASATDDAVTAAARDRVLAFLAMMAIAADGAAEVLRGTDFNARSYRGFGPELGSGAARVTDIWFAADRTLRLRTGDEAAAQRKRLVARAFQCVAAGSPELMLCGEVLLSGSGPDFFDLTLNSALLPVLIVLAEPNGTAVDISLLPFPSLCRGGLHYSELLGTDHVSNPLDQLKDLSDGFVKTYMQADAPGGQRLLSDIAVQVNGADGTEPMFSSAVLEWVGQVFGIAVAAAGGGDEPGESYLREMLKAAAPGVTRARQGGQFNLMLPPDAIPTIAALTAPWHPDGQDHAQRSGPYFVADTVTARPRLSVVLPPLGLDLLELRTPGAPLAYPVLRPHDASGTLPREQRPDTSEVHLAIRFNAGTETQRAMMLMPHAPDQPAPLLTSGHTGVGAEPTPVDAVIRATSPQHLDILLTSLLRQRNALLGQVVVERRPGEVEDGALQAVLDRLVPGRGRLAAESSTGAVIEGTASAFTIHAEDTMVLHDARTVETLLTLLGTERTATASCVILRESALRKGSVLNFESGGYFPSHVSLLSAPRLILSLPDCRDALPDMTYPVIANDPGFFMLRNDAAAALSGGAEAAPGIAYALKALAAGYRHLCTSVVRATSLKAASRREMSDPPGINHLGTRQWQAVLASVTLLKGLN